MKVWITQYALTQGIFEAEVRDSHMPTMKVILNSQQCVHKPHWHETKKEAMARAQVMLADAIKSAHKRIAKLESISISFK